MPESTFVLDTLQLGEPIEHKGVVLCPLFPQQTPRAAYLTLEDALPVGFRVTEVDKAGAVPELLARNPLDAAVLLYDGEELVGARQNRILNVTVLVPARSELTIPVSCVEEGRWSARPASFASARHTAYPELRRRKAERLLAAPLARGAAQHEVWEAVREKQARHASFSPTGAQSDIFAVREHDLDGLRAAFPLSTGQAGAVFAAGTDGACLDYVSRPEAFARLYPKLLDGYLLDALERLDGEAAGTDRLEAFVEAVAGAPRRRGPSPGLGEDVRLAGQGVVGSGLLYEGELLQLSAFATDGPRERQGGRIARPSRRRA